MAILVVDNESKTRDTLRFFLRNLGHKTILEAKNAEEALKLIEISKSKIRMILIDEGHRQDGLLLANRIQQKASLEYLPFVLMASGRLDKKKTSSRVDELLLKPFRMATLETAMASAFQNRYRSRNKAVFFGNNLPAQLSEAIHPARQQAMERIDTN